LATAASRLGRGVDAFIVLGVAGFMLFGVAGFILPYRSFA
jgi:hypothetical protein